MSGEGPGGCRMGQQETVATSLADTVREGIGAAHAARAAALVAAAYENGTAAPYMGIRMKCMEAAVRDRGIRTLDIFLTGLMEAGGLPDGLVLTLPKVTYTEQVTAMVRLLEAFE